MKVPTLMMAATVLATATTVHAANVRVAHLSPDAPAVDVLVNGGAAFTELPFGSLKKMDYFDQNAPRYQEC